MPDHASYKPGLKQQMAVAVSHHAAGRLDEAEAAYLDILETFPKQIAAIVNLATIAAQRDQPEKALSLYDRALGISPAFGDAWTNKAVLLKKLGRVNEALDCYAKAMADYDKVLSGDGENTAALMNKAVILIAFDRHEEALALYEKISRINPENYSVLGKKGFLLTVLGRIDEAMACYMALAKANPEDQQGEYSWSMLSLLCGDFKAGWPAHEARLRGEKLARRAKELGETCGIPKWTGEPLDGKTILIDAEQGLGDSIQFVRYAARLKKEGARTIFVAQASLVPLFGRADGIDRLVSREAHVPAADVYSPLMSLPGLLGDDATSFPSRVPYLEADPALVKHWRERLAAFEGFRIGIFWHGNPTYVWNSTRSIFLEAFRALAEIEHVKLISLQKGPGVDQIGALDPPFKLLDFGQALDEKSGAFMDSAAIIKNLDLVITSDSAIAHLAGALAAPLWILLSKPADWRWMLDCDTSPWYPTARIFRQEHRGDWAGLMARVSDEVRKHAGR